MGIMGPFDPRLLARGRYSARFFTRGGLVYERDEDTGTLHVLQPKKTTLAARLGFGREGAARGGGGGGRGRVAGGAGDGGAAGRGFTDLLLWMLQPNPESRPTATEALSHPWLSMSSDGAEANDTEENDTAGDARERSIAAQL